MKYSMMQKPFTALALVAVFATSAKVLAGGVVIVHPSNTNTLSEADIVRMFLGKKSVYTDGSKAIPIDHENDSPIRPTFVNHVLNKDEQQYKAYWAQQLFTGKGSPPKQVGDSADVKGLVAKNPALIGYIDSDMADGSVKVVMSFE